MKLFPLQACQKIYRMCVECIFLERFKKTALIQAKLEANIFFLCSKIMVKCEFWGILWSNFCPLLGKSITVQKHCESCEPFEASARDSVFPRPLLLTQRCCFRSCWAWETVVNLPAYRHAVQNLKMEKFLPSHRRQLSVCISQINLDMQFPLPCFLGGSVGPINKKPICLGGHRQTKPSQHRMLVKSMTDPPSRYTSLNFSSSVLFLVFYTREKHYWQRRDSPSVLACLH